MYVHIYICVCVYARAHAHAHTHTYTQLLYQTEECARLERAFNQEHGAIVGDEKGILDVWADYCKELPNNLVMEITTEENVQFRTLHDIRISFSQEVSAIIRKLKNNRPQGEDSIKA